MDCLHFTLYGPSNYDGFSNEAKQVADSFFTDGRYDLEMEIEPDTETRAFNSSTALMRYWKADVTARRFDPAE